MSRKKNPRPQTAGQILKAKLRSEHKLLRARLMLIKRDLNSLTKKRKK